MSHNFVLKKSINLQFFKQTIEFHSNFFRNYSKLNTKKSLSPPSLFLNKYGSKILSKNTRNLTSIPSATIDFLNKQKNFSEISIKFTGQSSNQKLLSTKLIMTLKTSAYATNSNDNKPTLPSSKLISVNLTKNLVYFTNKSTINFDKNTLTIKNCEIKQQKRPLCIIFSWMSGKTNQLEKYAKIYTNLDFDVIGVRIDPWQLLWPISGAQLIADELLKFLDNNHHKLYEPIVIHGFSVGGYVFGEVLVKIKQNQNKYNDLLKKVYAQIWDSAADIHDIPTGFPIAVFPNNQLLQSAFRSYVNWHMKFFYNKATKHYELSSKQYHDTLVMAPALFFVSKDDPIGNEKSNLRVKNNWESKGIKCTWKCWDKSKHVLHLKYHENEYMKLLMEHLQKNVLERIVMENQNFKAKL